MKGIVTILNTFFLFTLLLMTSLLSFSAEASEVEVDEIFIRLNHTQQPVEMGLVGGTTVGKGYSIVEIPASIVLLSADEEKTFPITLSMPISVGFQAGAAILFNSEMRVELDEPITIRELVGEFFGTRYGFALGIGGSYMKAKNQYGAVIKDFDFRVGSKFDGYTKVTILTEFSEEIEPFLLDTIISVVD